MRILKSNFNIYNLQKEVSRMSRVMAAANDDVLFVGADTQLTNSYNHTKQIDRKKIFYAKNIVICILGTIEIFTSDGNVMFTDYILDAIEEYKNNDIFAVTENLLKNIEEIYAKLRLTDNNTHILIFWQEDGCFYLNAVEVNFTGRHYPFGKVVETNKHMYIFNNHFTQTGEGIKNPDIIVSEIYNIDPTDFVTTGIQNAINDSTLMTVGGSVYSLEMNKNGEVRMYINGISEDVL